MGVPTISTDAWPVVVIVYPDSATVVDVDQYMVGLEGLMKRGELFGCAVDLNPLTPLQQSAEVRSRLAAGLDALYLRHPGLQVAEGLVATSTFVRGLIVANEWMRRVKTVPRRTFTDMTAAFDWVKAEVDRARAAGAKSGGR